MLGEPAIEPATQRAPRLSTGIVRTHEAAVNTQKARRTSCAYEAPGLATRRELPYARSVAPRLGSCFSGCGGLDLGLCELLGLRVAWYVESDPVAVEVYADRFDLPSVTRDIQRPGHLEPVEILAAGFPCQDLSHAGRQAGLARGARSALVFRAIELAARLRVPAVVLENSYHRWRAWMPELRRALWREGYASLPLRVSASEVGAPHLRYRGFLLAWRLAADAHSRALWQRPEWDAERLADALQRRWQAESQQPGLPRPVGLPSTWAPPPPLSALDDGIAAGLAQAAQRLIGNAVLPRVAEVVGLGLVAFVRDQLKPASSQSKP